MKPDRDESIKSKLGGKGSGPILTPDGTTIGVMLQSLVNLPNP
jgi:hypothetical protein